MKEMSVQFHKGVPTTFHLQKWSPKGGFLKLDDLMVEGGEDKELLNLLTKHSYHRIVLVPRHVYTWEIRQEYFQERPLCHSL